MLNFILLNLLVSLVFVVSIVENFFFPNAKQVEKLRKRLPRSYIFSFFGLALLLVLIIVFKEHNFARSYLLFSFGLLVIGHAIWLSIQRGSKFLASAIVIGTLVILYRIFFPSLINHTLFLCLALLWLGSFLVSTRLITLKRFIVISALWFGYDVVYVWFSHLSTTLATKTSSVGFPLVISVHASSIGTADLLWGILFLAIVKTTKQKIIGVTLLIAANLLLGFYSYQVHHISTFPLLVLWVPISFGFIFFINNRKLFMQHNKRN